MGVKLELEQNITGHLIEILLKDIKGVQFSKKKERGQCCGGATDWGTPAGRNGRMMSKHVI